MTSPEKNLTEKEAKQILEKMLEHIDNMSVSIETALIGEALRIAIDKLNAQ